MADNDKKGPRDISDLKARLGLKKQPGGAPLPGPVPAPPGAPVPVQMPAPSAGLPAALTGVPAPGIGGHGGHGGHVPPPPGFTPPPEPAAPPPDPRRDPFAAQQAAAAANLAAFYGVGQALPGDASAVAADAIKKPKPWPLIGGAIGAGVVAFGLGYFTGNISVSRNDYNTTTEQAAKVRDEVERIQKQVKDVAQLMLGKEIAQGGVNFAVIEKLKEVDLKEPDVTARLFKTNYASFEPSTVQQLFTYYNDVIVLSKQVTRHAMVTMNDKDVIEKFINKAKENAAKGDKRLGVILDYSQKLPSAQLVELASGVLCPKQGETDCPVADMKLAYRTSTGGAPQQRPLKGTPQSVVFPMNPTELQAQLMTGDTNAIAVEAYRRRNKDIVDTLARLAETEKQLIGSLKKRAEAAKLTTL